MHIAILAPSTPEVLTEFLHSRHRETAEATVQTNSTAPARIAAELLRRGFRVTVITYAAGEGRLELYGDGLTFIRVPSPGRARWRALTFWRTERRLFLQELERARPDVVHAHWTYEHALAAIDSRFPTVVTIRDAPLTVLRLIPTPFRMLRASLAYRVRLKQRHARFTAVSPYMAKAWRRQMCRAVRPRVIPNMLASATLPGRPEKSRRPTVVEIANGGKLKNVAVLVAAFSLVKRRFPAARLVLIGEGLGPDDNLARDTAKPDGLDFLGPLPFAEVQSHLRRSWVHAHVSLEESFGNTVLEAMLGGTVVIGGRTSGAVPWLLDSGRCGVLADVSNPTKLAEQIIGLIEDPEACYDLAQRATERARALFSPTTVVDGYLDEYSSAITSQQDAGTC